MALTATATTALQRHVIHTLGMINTTIIEILPQKNNLYFVVTGIKSIEDSLEPLIQELKNKRTELERTIIFCRRPTDCAQLWLMFKKILNKDLTEPPGYHDIAELRMVDYFTGCTEESVKKCILKQFSTPSCLKIVIATIAFGLGVDCPDVQRIIHFGIPEDIETYVQQVGRAGRNGKMSCCTMLVGQGVYKKHCNRDIISYCNNDRTCRRHLLCSHFGSYSFNKSLYHTCKCCDICCFLQM